MEGAALHPITPLIPLLLVSSSDYIFDFLTYYLYGLSVRSIPRIVLVCSVFPLRTRAHAELPRRDSSFIPIFILIHHKSSANADSL